jgi:hypothetical protein
MIDTAAVNASVNLLDLVRADTKLTGGPREFVGACPRCGGRDRFHLHIGKGWFCRQCTGDPAAGRWHDAIDYVMFMTGCDFAEAVRRLGGGAQLTPAERERIKAEAARAEAERVQAERKAQAEKRRALHRANAWRAYHDGMGDAGRAMWRKRGLSDMWQDYFMVGHQTGKQFSHGDTVFTSASLTIPYLRAVMDSEYIPRVECVGLVHRLLLPNAPGGKYRPHVAGLGKPLFYTDLFDPGIRGDVFLVEGEIKAMVLHAWLQDYQRETDDYTLGRQTVVGHAGKGFKAESACELDEADTITILPDPDAEREAQQTADLLGRGRCYICSLPGKVDDLLTSGEMSIGGFIEYLRTTRRAA